MERLLELLNLTNRQKIGLLEGDMACWWKMMKEYLGSKCRNLREIDLCAGFIMFSTALALHVTSARQAPHITSGR